MYNLFNQFEIISYKGVPVRNLFTRVAFADIVKKTGAVYYPYVVTDGERPDSIAYNYYEDARYAWLVYMSNDILDPYYDWPLNQEEFKSYITTKYSTRERAMETILYWKDNWQTDDTVKTPGGYEALPSNHKKYFSPTTGFGNSIVSYVRTPTSKVVETNKTILIAVSSSNGFQVGDLVKQYTNGVLSGVAQIKYTSTTSIVVNNIRGAIAATSGSVGNLVLDSGASTSVSTVTIINTAIPDDEVVYWSPVSAFEYEDALNNSKRSIRLIDKAYVDQIEKELDSLV
jgi:hypothetical protein